MSFKSVLSVLSVVKASHRSGGAIRTKPAIEMRHGRMPASLLPFNHGSHG